MYKPDTSFPCIRQNISFHLVHHIWEGVALKGPARSFWMFPFERLMSWVARRVTNRRFPEATVMATYGVST